MSKTINPMLTRCSALALSTSLLFVGGAAHAQSFNAVGEVAEGAATITEGAGTTDITVETDSVVIDWDPTDNQGPPFSDILFQDAGTTATFTNGTGISDFAVLNRILPSDTTRRIRLDGNIVSTIQDGLGGSATGGTVFFYSPSGIVIGANATIDVGNLGLTTAEPVTDGSGNFIIDDQVNFQQSSPIVGVGIEEGAQINALNEGSYVALFAPQITQNGDVNVNGQAAYVAGEAGSITFSPDGLFDIEVTIGTDNANAIEHGGFTGGPASTGVGDNHRAYLVAVAKNNAITLAINSGSSIGFDIANSAGMDGDVVVLSAGQNIVAGDFGLEAGGAPAEILLRDFEQTVGGGINFTSLVIGNASGELRGFIENSLNFEDDAQFFAPQAFIDVGNGPSAFGASLTAAGDLTIAADRPTASSDVGFSLLTVVQNSSLIVDGELRLSAQAFLDSNANGIIGDSFARLRLDTGSGASVGDLTIDTRVDGFADRNQLTAQGGFSQVQVENGATLNVIGVTRLVSDAISGNGGTAIGGVAEIQAASGGTITTGELNISADALGRTEPGLGGGNATAGSALITLFDAGSNLTVLAPNTIGGTDEELEFLSAEAIGAQGVDANGGNANGGEVAIRVANGASINLPDVPGFALSLRNSAIGGNTGANDSAAGTAQSGNVFIEVTDSSANLGRLSVISDALGGIALGGAERTTGGSAFGGQTAINFIESTVDVAFDDFIIDLLAGDSTGEDASRAGGSVFTNNFQLVADNSTVNINSDLIIAFNATGGAGGVGGDANLNNVQLFLDNTDMTVAGDFVLDISATGGEALAPIVIDPITGQRDLIRGGNADAFSNFIGVTNSNLSASGAVTIDVTVEGGSAFNGDGGRATIGSSVIDMFGNASFNAAEVLISNDTSGGSITAGGSGRGGNAISGEARFRVSEFNSGQGEVGSVNVTGDFRISNRASGGEGGDTVFVDPTIFNTQINQGGGEANTFPTTLNSFQNGSITIGGNLSVQTEVAGGFSPLGLGGLASSSLNDIFLELLDLSVTGDVTVSNFTDGGGGLTGGDAFNPGSRIFMRVGDADLLGDTFITALSVGGNAPLNPDGRNGGNANGGIAELNFEGGDLNIDLRELTSEARGGNGAVNSGNSGGNSTGANVSLRLDNALATFRSGIDMDALNTGGDGFSGGFANAGFGSIEIVNTDVTVVGNVIVDVAAIGGNALGASFDDAANGGANAFDGGTGGRADASDVSLAIDTGLLDINGELSLSTTATGGSAVDGDAGNASTAEAIALIRDGAEVTASVFNLFATATGGSVAAGGAGNGGEASAARAAFIIDPFDPATEEDRANTVVTLNTDLFGRSAAVGGNAGSLGGDGGLATTGLSSLTGNAPGQLLLDGFATLESDATGGNAVAGIGGAATSPGSELFAAGSQDGETGEIVRAADITMGDLTLSGTAIGGDGQTGGLATGPFHRLFVRNNELTINGTLAMNAIVRGGDALANVSPGDGGAANGGGVQVLPQNTPGDDPTVITMLDLTVDYQVEGGAGGNSLSGANGGRGGDASGNQTLVLARANDGTVNVTNDAVFNFNVIGGDGGSATSGTGGVGGEGVGGQMQIGSSSGTGPDGAVLVDVNGSANFGTLTITNNGLGGDGGSSASGTGGEGGVGQAGFTGLLVRGAPLNANSVSSTMIGTGGDGGAGATQGDGGDGIAGFASVLITQAFEHPGRGSANIDTLTIRANGIGGSGAVDGSSFYAGGRFEIEQSDVFFNLVDIELSGPDFPDFLVDDGMGGQVPVTVNPYNFLLTDATVDTADFFLITPGDLELTLENSTIDADVFAVTADNFVARTPDPNPEALPFVAGTISADLELELVAVDGSIETEATLSSNDILTLFASGGISVGDLSGANILLDVGNGPISTGAITANGGTVTISTVGTLDLETAFASVLADSITAQSQTGDVLSASDIFVSGDLTIEAGQSILVQGLNAQTITARALTGQISTGALEARNGGVILEAGDSIGVTDIDAESAIVTSQFGGFVATGQLIMPLGALDIDVAGLISLPLVDADSVSLTSTSGNIEGLDTIEVANTFVAGTGGSINLLGVTAGSIDVDVDGSVTVGDTLSAAGGSIRLDAENEVSFVDVEAASLDAIGRNGGITGTGTITLSGALVALGAGNVTLSEVNAASVTANALVGNLNLGTLNAATGAIDLDARNSIILSGVTGGSLNATTVTGDVIGNEVLNLTSGLIVSSASAITLAPVTAQTITLDAPDAVNLSSVNATSLIATVTSGAFEASGPITLTGALGVTASDVTLADVNSQAIFVDTDGTFNAGALNGGLGVVDIRAQLGATIDAISGGSLVLVSLGGDLTTTGVTNVTGDATLAIQGEVQTGDITADTISVSTVAGGASLGALSGGDVILTIEAGLSLSDVTADQFAAVSNVGDISHSGLISVAGLFSSTAAGSVALDQVTAGDITATATSGGITANLIDAANGTVTLTAANTLDLANINALSLVARSTAGDITSTELVEVNGAFDVEAAGDVSLFEVVADTISATAVSGGISSLLFEGSDVTLTAADTIALDAVQALSISAVSLAGDVTSTGEFDVADAVDIEAAGEIALSDVTAGSITLTTLGGGIASGFLDAVGAVTLTARDSIALTDTEGASILARSTAGDITSNNAIALTGALDVEAAGVVTLAAITASSISANAQGGALTVGVINAANGAIDLDAATSIALASVTGGSLNLDAASGTISGLAPITLTGDFVAHSVDTILLGDITASSITADVTGGDLLLGSLTADMGVINLSALGAISFANILGGSLTATTDEGDVEGTGLITLSDALNIDAGTVGISGAITLGDVTAQTSTLNAINSITVASLTGDTLTASTADGFTGINPDLGAFTASGAINLTGALDVLAFEVTLADVFAQGLSVFAAQTLNAGALDSGSGNASLRANGGVSLTQVTGAGLDVIMSNGDLSVSGSIDVDNLAAFFIDDGSVQVGEITAQSILVSNSVGGAIAGALTAGTLTAEDITLTIGTGLSLSGVSADTFDAVVSDGDLNSVGLIAVTGAFSAEASGSVALNQVNAGAITATATNGGISANRLEAANGTVILTAADTIALSDITANAILARSSAGDITSSSLIDLGGALDVEAAGEIVLSDVTAGSITATALGGGITTGALDATGGTVTLTSVDTIALADIQADSILATSTAGNVTSSALIDISGLLNIEAAGNVALSDVSADTLRAAADGSITLGAVTGQAITLSADTGAVIGAVNADTLTATVDNGAFLASNTLTLTGELDVTGSSVTFADVFAQGIDIDTSGLLTAGALDGGSSAISLLATMGAELTSVSSDTLLIVIPDGDLTVTGAINTAGATTVSLAGDVQTGAITAQSISLNSATGGAALGDLNAESVSLILGTNVSLADVTADSSFSATANSGDISNDGVIAVAGEFLANAGGSIALDQVSAATITATAADGDVTIDVLDAGNGTVRLTSQDTIALGGIIADSIIARSSAGDITSTALIELAGVFDIEAAGEILLSDVSASGITATALGGGITAGLLEADTVTLGAVDTIALSNIVANAIIARSSAGDITSSDLIDLVGALDVEAAGAVTLGAVNAGSISAAAQGGALSIGALDVGGGTIDLDAATTIALNGVTGGSLSLDTATGDISGVSPIVLSGDFDANSGASVTLGDITAGSITANAPSGNLQLGSLTSGMGLINLSALGSISFANILGGSLTATTEDGDVDSAGLITLDGVLNVDAGTFGTSGAITLGDVTAQTTTLNAINSIAVTSVAGETLTASTADGFTSVNTDLGAFTASGAITLTGALDVLAFEVNLADVSAQGISLLAGETINAGALDAGSQNASLRGNAGVSLTQVTGGGLDIIVSGGDLSVSGAIDIDNFAAFFISGTAQIGEITAQSIIVNTMDGGATLGALNSGDVTLEIGTDLSLSNVTADTFNAVVSDGDLTSLGLIAVSGALNAEASGSVRLDQVNAGSITATSVSGGITAGLLEAVDGTVTLNAADTIALTNINANSILARSSEGNITSSDAIILIGDLNVGAAGSVALGDVTAQSISIGALGGDVVTGALATGTGNIALDAAGGVSLLGATGGALSVEAAAGDITGTGPISLIGAFDAAASGSILLGNVTAGSITANATNGSITTGLLTADDGVINLSAATSIFVRGLASRDVTARALGGDFEAEEAIDLTGVLDIEAAGSIALSDATAQSITAVAQSGSLVAGTLTAIEPAPSPIAFGGSGFKVTANVPAATSGDVVIEAATSVDVSQISGTSAFARAVAGDVTVSDLIALSETLEIEAQGNITLGSVTAGTILLNVVTGVITVQNLNTDDFSVTSDNTIDLSNVSANSIFARSLQGDVISSTDIFTPGAFDVEAAGSVNLQAVTARSIRARALSGDVVVTGALTALDGVVDVEALGSVSLAGVVADSFRGRAQDGDFASSGLLDLEGVVDIEAQSLTLAGIDAGVIAVTSRVGDIFGEQPIIAQGTARFNSANDLMLGELTAGQIFTRSQGTTQINGTWAAQLIEVASPLLEFLDDGALDASGEGQITLISTNDDGLFIGDVGEAGLDDQGEPIGYTLGEGDLARIEAGDLFVTANDDANTGDALQILLGTLDLTAADEVGALRFGTGIDGLIRVVGDVTSDGEAGPQTLGFQSGRFELDTDSGRVDIAANGGALNIAADTIIVASGALIDSTQGTEEADTLIEAFNAPTTETGGEAPAPAISAGSLSLEGGSAILIQNSGTEETAAGFVVGSAEGLELSAIDTSEPLVVINGQIAADGIIVTGDEAATAILESAGEGGFAGVSPLSQINGCELGGCIVEDEGEITGAVSAQVNGVVDGGTSGSDAGGAGNSGGGDSTGGGDAGGGDTGGGDDGNTGEGDDGSDDSGTDAGASGSGAAGSGGSGSDGGDGVDNADDGGGGSDDFVIDEGSDDGSSGDGADGSDDGASDEGGSDEGGDDGADESGEDDSESGEEAGEEEGEGEDTDETEEESDEEEAEDEEEAAEEEEEDSEGPTTGPISAPAPLINTNNLEENTVITDPISGTGNPALLDPDITIPETPETGGQE